MNFLYNLGIFTYSLLARLASPFSKRAGLWTTGRRGWKEKISSVIKPSDRVFWIHCASLGEFEQGRPVIESVRKERPGMKILLTFFSPSGYEIRKNYPHADCISYLPADTPSNARKFLDLVHPDAIVFVKYEFWNNYISEAGRRRIPLYLISGIFREDQHFFRWYGGFFRKMLKNFKTIYVQDEVSLKLLEGIGIENAVVAGDTRFDRVVEIAASARDIPKLSAFAAGEKLFVGGSTWRNDEEIFARYINQNPGKMKWVFAPHETDPSNIAAIEALLSVSCIRFSQYDGEPTDARVMIIDNIGMLSSAYRYGYIAAVGGGFGKGIHNILEPACWGIPVLFGPRHEKFREALELLKEKGAFSFDSHETFSEIIDKMLSDEAFYLKSAKSASQYVNKNTGAAKVILAGVMSNI
jgi:3-deoxy-D-manno-octulosonic-acid transferase